MIARENLYIMDIGKFTKDLYRMGNAKWPAFTEDRARVDVAIRIQDGIEIVVANGKRNILVHWKILVGIYPK